MRSRDYRKGCFILRFIVALDELLPSPRSIICFHAEIYVDTDTRSAASPRLRLPGTPGDTRRRLFTELPPDLIEGDTVIPSMPFVARACRDAEILRAAHTFMICAHYRRGGFSRLRL